MKIYIVVLKLYKQNCFDISETPLDSDVKSAREKSNRSVRRPENHSGLLRVLHLPKCRSPGQPASD